MRQLPGVPPASSPSRILSFSRPERLAAAHEYGAVLNHAVNAMTRSDNRHMTGDGITHGTGIIYRAAAITGRILA